MRRSTTLRSGMVVLEIAFLSSESYYQPKELMKTTVMFLVRIGFKPWMYRGNFG